MTVAVRRRLTSFTRRFSRVHHYFGRGFESLVHRIELTCTMHQAVSAANADNLDVYHSILHMGLA